MDCFNVIFHSICSRTKKGSIICAKGNLEDVYAALVMANGAVI